MTFPIQYHGLEWRQICEKHALPRSVPWDFVEISREQAERNHGQSLERLRERGGLSPAELALVLWGIPLFGPTADRVVGSSFASLTLIGLRLTLFGPLEEGKRFLAAASGIQR